MHEPKSLPKAYDLANKFESHFQYKYEILLEQDHQELKKRNSNGYVKWEAEQYHEAKNPKNPSNKFNGNQKKFKNNFHKKDNNPNDAKPQTQKV